MNRREAKRIVCLAVARDLGIWIEEGLGGLLNGTLPSGPTNAHDDERLVDAALELAGELTRRGGAGDSTPQELDGQTTVDDFLAPPSSFFLAPRPPSRPTVDVPISPDRL